MSRYLQNDRLTRRWLLLAAAASAACSRHQEFREVGIGGKNIGQERCDVNDSLLHCETVAKADRSYVVEKRLDIRLHIPKQKLSRIKKGETISDAFGPDVEGERIRVRCLSVENKLRGASIYISNTDVVARAVSRGTSELFKLSAKSIESLEHDAVDCIRTFLTQIVGRCEVTLLDIVDSLPLYRTRLLRVKPDSRPAEYTLLITLTDNLGVRISPYEDVDAIRSGPNILAAVFDNFKKYSDWYLERLGA